MDRRRYLGLVTGVMAGLAGCGSNISPKRDTTPSPTPAPVTQSSTPTQTPTPTGVTADINLSRYLVRSFCQTLEQRAITPEDITPLTEIEDPLRSALRTAIKDEFRTDSIAEALLVGIDQFRHYGGSYRFHPYISVDGTPYIFDPTVPVFTAHLEGDLEDPDPERTAGPDGIDRFPEPVQQFIHTVGAFGVEVARDEYRISVIPEPLADFLDTYEYVQSPANAGRIVTERIDPGPPYTITAHKLTAEEIWGRPIIGAEELSTDLREFVEAVVASNRRAAMYSPMESEYRTDTIPPAYGSRLSYEHGPGSGPYVTLNGTHYAIRVTEIPREKLPVEVTATSVGERSFSVTVQPSDAGPKPSIEGQVELEARGALPSVLWIQTNSDRYLLESDSNENIRWTDSAVSDGPERRIRNIARTEIPPDGQVAATYRVPADVPAGTYEAWGLVRVQWTKAESGRRYPSFPYPFRVGLSVPEAP